MTQAQDDEQNLISVITANCPPGITQALETALAIENHLRFRGEITLDLTSMWGQGAALARLSPLMADGVLIVVLHLSETTTKLPRLFTHLLEEYTGLRILVISGPLIASSITAYWMSLRWNKLTVESPDRLSEALLNGIRFVTTLDPSQDESKSSP